MSSDQEPRCVASYLRVRQTHLLVARCDKSRGKAGGRATRRSTAGAAVDAFLYTVTILIPDREAWWSILFNAEHAASGKWFAQRRGGGGAEKIRTAECSRIKENEPGVYQNLLCAFTALRENSFRQGTNLKISLSCYFCPGPDENRV
jgi:hypothetical protein